MNRQSPLFLSQKAVGESNHLFIFKRAQRHPACPLRCYEGCGRHYVEVAKAPNHSLNLFNLVELGFGLGLTDIKLPVVGAPSHHKGLMYSRI